VAFARVVVARTFINSSFSNYTQVQQWSKPVNCESYPRTWHSATFLEQKNILLVFGGERNVTGTPEVLDDIMVLDTEIFLWYPPAVSGKPPSPRAGHTASLVHQVRALG
jgi:hypothetical protein